MTIQRGDCYSERINSDIVKASGSFTTLEVRRNIYDHEANLASERVMQDWAKYIGDGQELLTLNACSKLGNMYSFTFIESPPDRLDVAAYWGDLGLLHDDHTEAAEETEAWAEHGAFAAAINFHQPTCDQGQQWHRALGMKRMAAESMLKGMKIDRERCLYMVDKYRTDWVDVVEKPRPEEGFSSLKEYMNYRNQNVGMSAFWPMLAFSMGYEPTAEEHDLVQHVLEPIEEGICLTNDYWSWERELSDHLTNGNRINNSVDVAMRTMNLDQAAAKEWLKERLIGLECEYVQRKVDFYQQHPRLSLELRRWIELAGSIMGGTHFWASSCPRHHGWKEHRERAQKIPLIQDDAQSRTHNTIQFDDNFSDHCSTASTSLTTPDIMSESVIDKSMGSEGLNPIIDIRGTSNQRPTQNEDDRVLMGPINYIASMPSKGVRSMLVESFNLWLKVPESSMRVIEKIVADLHNASLILDDIEDDSDLRRGQMATHLVFGQAQAINSANFMFVRAVREASGMKNEVAVPLLLHGLERMYQGQALDLYWKHAMICPSISEYLHMVDCKTGGLFRMLLQLAKSESTVSYPSSLDLDTIVLLFGHFFQIRDDYMNLCSAEYGKQKGSCEDLDEGKFSYPLIQLFDLLPECKDEVLGILRLSRRPNQKLPEHAKQQILNLIHASGAMDATRSFLRTLEGKIDEEIKKLETAFGDSNPMLRLLIERLSGDW
ncbi:isoprenoid synthase domain-containing protein [Bipolaris maydis]|uniref:isoprenoid synthase domain-containing protein n=1 Tax=Cochliobolus heterostrophus TaxID=5016 RepID=UPI0024D543EC|nr:isoprenoid synthase domain-containing protein [Bipolaris maydis]KAJ6266802.1 isoprenoid synthase domain-containing protein [Bipolaris maydis]KAJ6282861.1 isoprenoid synthase domain-containing protein [Bipolaris maydis]